MNARTPKSQNKTDSEQNRKINVLRSKLDATLSLLNSQRQRNNVSRTMLSGNRQLTMKEMEFVPSLINARNGDLTSESPLLEKVMRTRLDPAHAARFAKGVSCSNRSYTHSSKGTFTLTSDINYGLVVVSLPFLECPFAYTKDGGNTWYGRWGDSIGNIWNRINLAKAEASRYVGKSLTADNITKGDDRIEICHSVRLDPCFNLGNKCDSTWFPTASGTSVNMLLNYAPVAANRKVIQNVPFFYTDVSLLSTKHTDGVYLVNKVLDNDFRTYQTLSDKCAAGGDIPPAAADEYSVLRLGKLGDISDDGSKYVLNEYSFNSACPNNARLPVSKLMNTDLTAFFVPPLQTAQTYSFQTFEHVQYITSDMTLLNSQGTDQPYSHPELDTMLSTMNYTLSGTYPPEFNSWGSIWSWIKDKTSKATNFYKKNSALIKPALSLIPGASTALDMVDKLI